MVETDIQLLIRHIVDEAFNHGQLNAIDRLVASPVLINGQPEPAAAFKESVRILHQLYPDMHVTIDEMSVLRDFVITYWTFHRRISSGLHQRSSLRLFRVTQGRIVEIWFDWAAREHLDVIKDLHDL